MIACAFMARMAVSHKRERTHSVYYIVRQCHNCMTWLPAMLHSHGISFMRASSCFTQTNRMSGTPYLLFDASTIKSTSGEAISQSHSMSLEMVGRVGGSVGGESRGRVKGERERGG